MCGGRPAVYVLILTVADPASMLAINGTTLPGSTKDNNTPDPPEAVVMGQATGWSVQSMRSGSLCSSHLSIDHLR